ncbi:FUSC family protein [Saccharopolyspora mangrovi]|uniref:FUSC family protein n=1 Tax=Saccharopolyspora mangrovi TaxID=3082379 RepID=A0ABU6AHS2_9PSEU|nr:FUSC family protein [Saccharopolyspora sp. S2-29]MEB3371111.1 FUSC family protein [Saccharopolyspora sp. S2-29]
MGRLREELSRRLRRLLRTGVPIVQCAVAAGVAWFLAHDIVGHAAPFFAPIAAVISLGVSLGQRMRRALELVVGVSIGIGVGDVLISVIGSGPWQIALVVALAMSTAVLLDSGGVIVLQAASSSVLVATLLPPATSGGLTRMLDAVVGGLVGFAVAALLPANPLAVAHRNGRVVLGALADALRGVASAVARQDASMAADVLAKARKSHKSVEEFRAALEAGAEIARFAPIRWRRRGDLERYETAATPIDRALRNTRVLARRALAALRDGEPVPRPLPGMLEELAGTVVLLRDELASGKDPLQARESARSVAKKSTVELLGEGDFSMQVVVLQVRSIAVDLLQASGLTRNEAMAALPPLHPDD